MQDDASAHIQSLQTSTEIKLCQNPWNGLYSYRKQGMRSVSRLELDIAIQNIDNASL